MVPAYESARLPLAPIVQLQVTMRGVAIVILGLTACHAAPTSYLIAGCEVCGSGALRAGRMLPNEGAIAAAAPNGVIAYSDSVGLTWLGSDFSILDSTDFAPTGSGTAARIANITADASDAVYVGLRSHVITNTDAFTSLIGLDADHHQMFRVELGDAVDGVAVTGDPAAGLAVFVPETKTAVSMTAIHTADGTVAWTTGLVTSQAAVSLAASPDGTVVLAGLFDALALGGNMNQISGMAIAAFDPATGIANWVVTASGSQNALTVATGPGGEVALAVVPTENTMTIAGQTFTSPVSGTFVALLEPTGALRWAQFVPGFVTSLVTDGTVVELSGLAQLSASGIDWSANLGGHGPHTADVLAVYGSRIIAAIGTGDDIDGNASLIDGDVTVPGAGTLIAEVAR
jgi:hypothetical protein